MDIVVLGIIGLIFGAAIFAGYDSQAFGGSIVGAGLGVALALARRLLREQRELRIKVMQLADDVSWLRAHLDKPSAAPASAPPPLEPSAAGPAAWTVPPLAPGPAEAYRHEAVREEQPVPT